MSKIRPADTFVCHHGEPRCAGEKPAGRRIPIGKGIYEWLLWVAGDPATIEEGRTATYCFFHRAPDAQPLVDWARAHDLLDEEAFAAKFVPPPAVEVPVTKRETPEPVRSARRGKRKPAIRTASPERPAITTAPPSRSKPSRTGSSGNLKPLPSTKPGAQKKPAVSVCVPLPVAAPPQVASSRKPVLPPASLPIVRPPRSASGRDERLTFKIGEGVDLAQILEAQREANASAKDKKAERRREHEARTAENARRRAEEAARLEAERQAAEAQAQLEADLARKRKEGHERYLAQKAMAEFRREQGIEPRHRAKGVRVASANITVDGREVTVVRFVPKAKGFAEGLAPILGEEIPVGVAAPAAPEGMVVPEKVDVSAYAYRKVVDSDGVLRIARIGQELLGNVWTTVVRVYRAADPESGLESGWYRRWLSQDDLPVAYSGDELFNALVRSEVNRLEADSSAKDAIVARDHSPSGKVVYQLSLLRLWETIYTDQPEAQPEAAKMPSVQLVVDINAEA